jgi:hypothetical protein
MPTSHNAFRLVVDLKQIHMWDRIISRNQIQDLQNTDDVQQSGFVLSLLVEDFLSTTVDSPFAAP